MADDWFCEIAGRELGPLSSHQLKTMAAKGQILPNDCVRQGAGGKWVPAGQLKGLFQPRQDATKTAAGHQPAAAVSGEGAPWDVPVHVIGPPDLVALIEGWGWSDGLVPDAALPAWPMEAFRDRFIEAFSTVVPPA
jgi:hypothetical protein